MCRMLAMISLKPLITHYLDDFRRLAEIGKVKSDHKTPGHKDGWGIVHIDKAPTDLGHKALHEDGPVEANASTSKGYEKAYGNIEKERMNGIFLSHLRKASSGKKVRENTPPFIENNWVFSHNGNIYGLGNEQFSDSRIFFKMLVEKITETRDLQKGIYEVINKIKENYEYDSLTFLLSNNNTLCAYRDFAKEDDYYTIKYAITKDSTLILVQEEIWNLNWNTVPNESLIIVNNDLRILGPLKI